MTVWVIKGKIIKIVLHNTVYDSVVQNDMHIRERFYSWLLV